MKILDIPRSGKCGVVVSQGGRFGQFVRTLVIPTNPRTEDQMNQRSLLTQMSQAWRNLTESQRLAWDEAGRNYQSRPRCGTSGPLTGIDFFVRINCNLAFVGDDTLSDPPAFPGFEALVPSGFSITNTGTPLLRLTCATSPNEYTLVWASPPKSQGVLVTGDYRFIGQCPAPAGGYSNITSLYTAKFGSPAVGKKVFVRCNQMRDGFQDLPESWSAIVPAEE